MNWLLDRKYETNPTNGNREVELTQQLPPWLPQAPPAPSQVPHRFTLSPLLFSSRSTPHRSFTQQFHVHVGGRRLHHRQGEGHLRARNQEEQVHRHRRPRIWWSVRTILPFPGSLPIIHHLPWGFWYLIFGSGGCPFVCRVSRAIMFFSSNLEFVYEIKMHFLAFLAASKRTQVGNSISLTKLILTTCLLLLLLTAV